jgi:predicted AAA+ superfamily ATPase
MSGIHERYLKHSVSKDLKDRMVFIGGPRQVGKTTFALTFLSEPTEKHPAYLNWDNIATRSSLLKGKDQNTKILPGSRGK